MLPHDSPSTAVLTQLLVYTVQDRSQNGVAIVVNGGFL